MASLANDYVLSLMLVVGMPFFVKFNLKIIKYIECVLASGSSGPDLSPGQGHCVVFLGKTLDSHSASPHPGV